MIRLTEIMKLKKLKRMKENGFYRILKQNQSSANGKVENSRDAERV